MDLAIVPPLRRPLRPEGTPDPLREQLAVHVECSVLSLLDPAFIEALAEDMRLVQRKRVHHAGLMVCAFVLSAFERSTDTEGRLLDARITYERLGGPPSGKTSFRKMAHKLLPVHHRLLRRRLRRLAATLPTEEMRGRLLHLADVLIPDGCAFKLARALSGLYPGTGTAAELKLHAIYSIKAKSCIEVHSTAGSVHDSDGFWPASWVSGALYLWDLGYQNYERFVDATEAGAYVLQRLKELSNPVILASYGPTGCRRPLVGQEGRPLRLNEACEFGYVHHQTVLDLDVEIAAGSRKVMARVVCVPHQGEDRYYLTTLPRDIFSAHDIAELYRVRWEVELLFRSWKGAVRLDEVRRLSHPHSLELAITSSLLAALLGREIHDGLERLTRERAASLPTAALPAAVFPLRPDLPNPPPTRTPFAVNLQLGRSFSSLALLVQSGYEGHADRARAEARLIASAIFQGARDRSRDPHLRSLRDQQARSASLHTKRPARKKVTRVSPLVRKAAIPLRAPGANGAQPTAARLRAPGGSPQLRPLASPRRTAVEHTRSVRLRRPPSVLPSAAHVVAASLWASVDWRNQARTAQGDKVAA